MLQKTIQRKSNQVEQMRKVHGCFIIPFRVLRETTLQQQHQQLRSIIGICRETAQGQRIMDAGDGQKSNFAVMARGVIAASSEWSINQ